jgi:hypothetical protein
MEMKSSTYAAYTRNIDFWVRFFLPDQPRLSECDRNVLKQLRPIIIKIEIWLTNGPHMDLIAFSALIETNKTNQQDLRGENVYRQT